MASAATPLYAEDDVFERLKQPADPAVLQERQEAIRERVQVQYERAQRRLAELISNNSTLPVHIRSVHVEGANRTRGAFLQKVFEPLLKPQEDATGPYTLETAMKELQKATAKLHRFEIFKPEISISLDTPPADISLVPSAATSSKLPAATTPLDVLLSVKERSLFTLKSGTDLGNTQATGYLTASTLNFLGLADKASVSFSAGTRTRSSSELNVSLPVPTFSNPDFTLSAGAHQATRDNTDYASHELLSKGSRVGVRYVTPSTRDIHDLAWEGAWRQVTGLTSTASPSIRREAGDSIASALKYTFIRDWRDNPLIPTSGYLFKSISELAGGSYLGGDVKHLKHEAEAQFATTLLPRSTTASSTPTSLSPPPSASASSSLRNWLESSTLTTTIRSGILYPLQPLTSPSRLPDRFTLGGPSSLRSFKESGLGPRDGSDALGGDLYLSAAASLLFPIPHLGPDKPVRFQAYVNGGRLVAWDKAGAPDVLGRLKAVLNGSEGAPSLSAGVGLVYVAGMARFELNFGVPVVVREGERGRKGFQFGVGINVM
ncbi:surface antigen-domain-containing protein [Peziza echinospora]|nr:surface antigen-domain-containing protein [Peziza echinospora]